MAWWVCGAGQAGLSVPAPLSLPAHSIPGGLGRTGHLRREEGSMRGAGTVLALHDLGKPFSFGALVSCQQNGDMD